MNIGKQIKGILSKVPGFQSSYGQTPQELIAEKEISEILGLATPVQMPKNLLLIQKGKLARTDRWDVDQDIINSIERFNKMKAKGDIDGASKVKHLLSRGLSLMDLTSQTYSHFNQNPDSIAYWFPLMEKLINQQEFFKVPKTKIVRLPIEMAQYIRTEWQNSNQKSRDYFNQFIFNHFELKDGKTYFIKTGTFSQKFLFANCKCSEPLEMGDYFHVINNKAMELGAAHTNDLCVREYIEDVENNPTIYSGMPLHTEYRVFVNMENGYVYGATPYWNPIVMKKTFKMIGTQDVLKDLSVYAAHEETLMTRFNENVGKVVDAVKQLISKNKEFVGQWSIDVMQNGEDFYLIDMAQAQGSALAEFLPGDGYQQMKSDIPAAWDWTAHLFESDFYGERLKSKRHELLEK